MRIRTPHVQRTSLMAAATLATFMGSGTSRAAEQKKPNILVVRSGPFA